MLGQEEIETFHTQGYLVVPNVLAAEEISQLETVREYILSFITPQQMKSCIYLKYLYIGMWDSM